MITIILKLKDDEFLELGAMGWGVDIWTPEGRKKPIGRLFVKIRQAVKKQATEGQQIYLDKVTAAIKYAIEHKEVDSLMVKEGFANIMEDASDRIIDED